MNLDTKQRPRPAMVSRDGGDGPGFLFIALPMEKLFGSAREPILVLAPERRLAFPEA